MNFTKEQLATLINDRNQVVIANAGSGKTTILVEKYLELIRQIPASDLQKIVAITFTKKAAAEMKERVISRLIQEIDELKNKDIPREEFFREYQNLMEYREHISGAKIQTIHSFCQDILKEFAVEAGFSPNFNLLEDTLLDELKDNFFKETLEEFLVDYVKKSFKANDFFDAVDKNMLNSIIMLLINNPSAALNFKELFQDKSYEEYQNIILPLIIKIIEEKHGFLIREILNVRDELTFENKNGNLKTIFEKIDSGLTKLDSNNILGIIDEYIYLWKEVKSQKVKVNRLIKGYTRNPDEFDKTLSFLLNSNSIKHLETFYNLNKFILSFYNSFEEKIEDYKVENSVITYDDMLVKTHKLLFNEEITKKVGNKYEYLLIDEFQDTDDIQYAIIKKIVPSVESADKHGTSSKIFLVGDPKQSIYGFRNADVRVMKKAEKEITSTNFDLSSRGLISNEVVLNHRLLGSQSLAFSNEENLGKIELRISHRLNVVNTLYVNSVFEKLMAENSFDFAVKYNQFIFARENPYISDLYSNNSIISDMENDEKFGSVKFLFNIENNKIENIDEINNESKENGKGNFGDSEIESNLQNQTEIVIDNENEARLVSKYIYSLIADEKYIYDSNLKSRRRILFSDIGILVRKRNGVDKLLNQMDLLKIPYMINDSKNFFQTQEVIDIISFLKFLYNPNDNLAFASLLKSNFFKFSDNDLFQLRKSSETHSLWECFHVFIQNKTEYKFTRANKILTFYAENFRRIPLGLLLQEIIDSTNFLQTFALSSSKNSILLNIKSFINFVKRISNRGLSTFNDLMYEINKSYIDKMVSDEILSSEENSVNILTIHKSKGLEFPVVILYNMNSKGGNSDNINYNDIYGLTFKFNVVDDNNENLEIKLPIYEISKEYTKKQEQEEDKRILYVAATRAKDILIISSTLKMKKPKKNAEESLNSPMGLFKLIMDGMSINNKQLLEIIDENKYVIKNSLTAYINNEYEYFNIEFQVPFITEIENQNQIIEQQYSTQNNFYFLLDEVKSNPPVFSNSATKIQSFLKKPVDFVERYVLQLPEILKTNQFITKEGELSGADRGTLIHKGMSELNFWVNEENSFNKKMLQEIISNEAFTKSLEIPEILVEEIVDEVLSVVNSNFIKSNLSELLLSEKELELNMPFGNDFIQVIIDSLVRMKDGSYEIWDWKSNIVKDEEKFNELTENYKLQLKYYAFVVSYLYPEQEKFIARLFFTRLAGMSKEDSDWIATFEWSRNELNEFAKELVEYFDKMHNPEEMYKYLVQNL